jgi:hypothetical protein
VRFSLPSSSGTRVSAVMLTLPVCAYTSSASLHGIFGVIILHQLDGNSVMDNALLLEVNQFYRFVSPDGCQLNNSFSKYLNLLFRARKE